jgi:nitroreductase
LEKSSQRRREVGDLAYQFSLEQNNNPALAEAAREKVMAPPVLVFAYCIPGRNDEVTRENYASVCCAIQNMALAGVAEGLTVTWDTGRATRHPRLKETLGAEGDWNMAGMLSIGVSSETPVSQRTSVSQFVHWFE